VNKHASKYYGFYVLKRFLRWIAIPFGLLLFIIGTITFPLPLPIGLPLMIIGVAVACANPLILKRLKRWRKKFPNLNRKIRKVTPHMPTFIRKILNRTDNPDKG